MSRSRLVALVLGLAAVVAVPAVAAKRERVGDRINVLTQSPATFPAGTPFHVAQGWNVHPDDTVYDAAGKFAFTLELDGRVVRPSYVERSSTIADNGFLPRSWVFNFPDGLPAGTHTFTGTWTGPCAELVLGGYYAGSCPKPTAIVVAVAPLSHSVTFTP